MQNILGYKFDFEKILLLPFFYNIIFDPRMFRAYLNLTFIFNHCENADGASFSA